jgi:hypothetical protein
MQSGGMEGDHLAASHQEPVPVKVKFVAGMEQTLG